ncbi:MAG: hypothetical protein DI538_25875 [Azospira oryzae]|nr:MAG: hypothetical protein DI538_25875 [Azospira oryzae]
MCEVVNGLDDGGRLLPLVLRRQARAALDDMERQPAARGVLVPGLHDRITTVPCLWPQRPAARRCRLACVHWGKWLH